MTTLDARSRARIIKHAWSSYDFCRYNDRNYQWVYDDTWIYETEFNITDEVEARENIDLVLEGVDTVAVVHVNNQLVGRLNNAHRCKRFRSCPPLSL